jgi:hypothetical protein
LKNEVLGRIFWENSFWKKLWTCRKILDGHLFRHLPPAPFHVEIENTAYKRLIGSQPHFRKPFAPILVFLSQMDRL